MVLEFIQRAKLFSSYLDTQRKGLSDCFCQISVLWDLNRSFKAFADSLGEVFDVALERRYHGIISKFKLKGRKSSYVVCL